MIAHKGEAATEAWLRGVKANLAHKPAGGDREQARDIYSGKCDLALGNTYYMALMMKNDKNPEQKEWAAAIKVTFPNAGDRGSHVNISGMALAKHAPNKANAVKLMEFLASEEAQKIYAIANNEYPVNPKVPASDIVMSWGKLHARSAAAREHRQVPQEGVRAGRQGQLRRRPELVDAWLGCAWAQRFHQSIGSARENLAKFGICAAQDDGKPTPSSLRGRRCRMSNRPPHAGVARRSRAPVSAHACPSVSNMVEASASLLSLPAQTTNWKAW